MVHKGNGEERRRFKESERGLYYLDTKEQGVTLASVVKESEAPSTKQEVVLVDIVEQNKANTPMLTTRRLSSQEISKNAWVDLAFTRF
jgi:hypothetical protein